MCHLLDGGRTAHSRFGLPFTPHEQSTCSICRESPAAELLRQADFIVWDEVTMAHKHVIEAFDRLLKDLMQNQRPFGGKLILFAGTMPSAWLLCEGEIVHKLYPHRLAKAACGHV